MTIGERIRAARKKAGLTQNELAEKLGISPTGVGQWETGRRTPKIESIKKIASVLEIPFETLILDDGNESSNTMRMDETNNLKDWKTNMDANSTTSMLGDIANTVTDSERMKAFVEKRMKDEERNRKVDDLTVHVVETMIILMDKIDERIQNSDLTNEQLISLSNAMMTISTSMGMLRAGMGWGYNGCHV